MAPTGTVIDPLAVWSVALVAISGAFALIVRSVRGITKMVKKIDEFMEDWNGIDDRPGRNGRPGVMQRLVSIEHELRPNSGESLRDAINRIESKVDTPP